MHPDCKIIKCSAKPLRTLFNCVWLGFLNCRFGVSLCSLVYCNDSFFPFCIRLCGCFARFLFLQRLLLCFELALATEAHNKSSVNRLNAGRAASDCGIILRQSKEQIFYLVFGPCGLVQSRVVHNDSPDISSASVRLTATSEDHQLVLQLQMTQVGATSGQFLRRRKENITTDIAKTII
jgi:hypothetical protein